LLNGNKFYSPGQKNQCYLFCIMRKFVQCGKYFRSHAVPPSTCFTVLCTVMLIVYGTSRISVHQPMKCFLKEEVRWIGGKDCHLCIADMLDVFWPKWPSSDCR
jgi:hypothetical protein